jgi:hypothetical protein
MFRKKKFITAKPAIKISKTKCYLYLDGKPEKVANTIGKCYTCLSTTKKYNKVKQ